MGGRPINVLSSKILDGAAFCLPIGQGAIHLVIFHQCFNVISRHAFWISASEKWRNSPSFFAVIRLDLCHALNRSFGAHFVRPFPCLEISKLDLALHRNQQLTSRAQRLEIVQRGSAALGLVVLTNQLVDGRLILSLRENRGSAEGRNNEKDYKTQMHRK